MNNLIYQDDAVKLCSKCNETKSVCEFHKSGFTKQDGTQSLDSWCRECRNEYQKRYPGRAAKYARNNKEKVSTRMKKAYDADPEKYREKSRKWREDHKDELKGQRKRWRENQDRFATALRCSRRAAKNGGYKSCSATRKEIELAFTGRCDICSVPEAECTTKLHMDHCHETGEFRGFLCKKCNTMLGMSRDSVEILVNAIHFLKHLVEK